MKKRFLLIIAVCFLYGQLAAQPPRLDTVAVSILDRTSQLIGELNSASVTVKSNYDISSASLGLVKHADIEHVYIGGPDKLLIDADGDKGNREVIYNGQTLSYYSVEKNHYAQIKAAPSMVEMIDHMSKKYGMTFPMADFLYPTFVDDILADAYNLVLLGTTKVDGKDCFHIAGTAKDKSFQFWIADDAFHLPVKMVIVYTNKPMNPQYEATYTDWQINPVLPTSMFEFTPPPGAKKIKLVPLAAKK